MFKPPSLTLLVVGALGLAVFGACIATQAPAEALQGESGDGPDGTLTVKVHFDLLQEFAPGIALGELLAWLDEPRKSGAMFIAFGHEDSDEAEVERLPLPVDGSVAVHQFSGLQFGKWWVTIDFPQLRLDSLNSVELSCDFPDAIEINGDTKIDLKLTPIFERAPSVLALASSIREDDETWQWSISQVVPDQESPFDQPVLKVHGRGSTAVTWLDPGQYQLVATQQTSQGAFHAVSTFQADKYGYRGRVGTIQDRVDVTARFALPEGNSLFFNGDTFQILDAGGEKIQTHWMLYPGTRFENGVFFSDLGYLPQDARILHLDSKQTWQLSETTELIITEGGIRLEEMREQFGG